MLITIHDTNDLSDLDIKILGAVVGQPGVANKVADAVEATPAPAKKATPAPAKKATPAPAEPEEATEEPVAEEEGNEDLRAQMVALCTDLVSNGGAAKVKKALTDAGAKKISEVTDDKVADVIAALS